MPRPIRPSDFRLYRMLSEPSISPDGKRIAVSVRRADVEDDAYDSDIYVAGVDGSRPVRFTSGRRDMDPAWSPDGRQLLFLSRRGYGREEKGNALYVIPASGGEAHVLVRGKESIEGAEWSPDSKHIYYRSNVVKEEKDDVRVIDRVNFWFNGLGFVHNKRKHAFRVDVRSRKVEQLTKGQFEVTDLAVSNGGKELAYLAATDDLRPFLSDLYVMDLPSRRKTKMTSGLEISGLAWSPDDTKVAICGNDRPAGFASHDHVMVVSLRPRSVKKAESVDRNKANSLNSDARAKAHAPHRLLWDREGIYFLQGDGGAVHLYRLKPGRAPELVVDGDRSVEGYDARSGKVAFVAMDSSRPEELFLKKGRGDARLTSFNEKTRAELDVLPSHHISFKASDGEAIEGWVMLPRGAKKVPAVLYVHGGPKTAFGHSYMHEFQAFAAAGYAVVFLNPRGSDGYSEEFSDIRGQYGTRDYRDLMEGLDYAVRRFPQIDGERLAIAGGSYGGYMTNWAIGQTDRFRAAVTDRSISNWVSMWGVSDIGPYFTSDQIGGDPWNAEEKLLADSPLRYVKNVRTPLMLIHSMEDYRCPFVEGVQFFTALKELGKEAELVLFPGENHDLSRVGKPKHRVARLEHYIRWFDRHLKGAPHR